MSLQKFHPKLAFWIQKDYTNLYLSTISLRTNF